MNFNIYFQTNKTEIESIIWKIIRQFGVPSSIRDDVFAECLVTIIAIWSRFDITKGVKFSTFAYLHILGTVTKELRRHSKICFFTYEFKQKTIEDDYRELGVESLASSSQRYETERLIIGNLVNNLPPKEKVVIQGHYYEAKSVKQIALELNLTAPAIRFRLKVALSRLGEELGAVA